MTNGDRQSGGADPASATDAPAAPRPPPPEPTVARPSMGARLWQFLKSGPGVVVSVVVGAAALIGAGTQIYSFLVGSRLAVTELKCEQRELAFRVTNSGGRAATIDPPRFTILAEGRREPLEPADFDAPALEGGTVEPGVPKDLRYRSTIDYFSRESTAGGRCRIEITVPNNSSVPEITSTCRCTYKSN